MNTTISDIVITAAEYQFIIKKNNDYYIVKLLNGKILDWIDALNMYSINKKVSSDKLIEKIKKKLNIEKIIYNTLNNDKYELQNNLQNNHEIKIYSEIERLKTLSDKNKLHDKNNNVKKIFNDNTIRDIIINEYIKIWKNNIDDIQVMITDNIYIWNITYNLNLKINMKILFDSNYFPYVPPQIHFISPKLYNKLDHRITNCKIFKLNYWNNTTSILEIINIIKEILIKYAQIDEIKSTKKINIELYQKLLLLSSYINDDETDELNLYFNKYIIKNTTIEEKPVKKSKSTNSNDKFNGTGYRIGDNSTWKIEDYENVQKTKEFELISILTGIRIDIDKINKDELYDTIENSLLIKFLVDTFKNTTLLDISKRLELFKLCFNIVQNLCVDTMIKLLFDDKYNLFNSIKKLYESAQLSSKFDNNDENNEIITQILFVWSLLEPLFNIFNKTSQQSINNDELLVDDINNNYKKILYDLRFDTANVIISNYKNSYLNEIKSGQKTSVSCMKRLSTEIPTLANDLPIHEDASIFLRVDETNPRAMRALITGPPDTPYDSGIFIFDIYLPPDYPIGIPMVNFTNTGGKRFNPNLYNCGKVCLSILGTYVGPTASQTEKWNTSSTLYQVLLSIQGQILVEHPYFNEPGYQHHYKTAIGDKNSVEYNKKVYAYTMQHAMLDLLENDNIYPEFKNVIKNHFKLKKNKIIDICTKLSNKNNHLLNISEKIINILNKL
jgi:ubiquitin-protein ligase